jgi:TetR/AcrR family transcriptional regulator
MTKKQELSAKERLLQAAIRLFAKKGYSATGLREIVREAGVSVAMVNYHFGSKQALLEAILDRFFFSLYSVAEEILTGEDPPELKLRRYLRAVVGVFRKNPDLVRIAITELPNDMPGIVQFKADRVTRMLGLVAGHILPALPEEVRNHIRLEVVGPAIVGMLTFHFLMRPVIQNAFQIKFDSSFYENYADELADIFMYGIFRGVQP